MIRKDNIFDSSNTETRKKVTILLYERVNETLKQGDISSRVPSDVM